MTSELVLLGRIVGAHGIKGEVKIATFTATPEGIASYGALFNVDGTRRFEVVSMRVASGGAAIARLKGVSDRTAAENLRGVDLYAEKSAFPDLSGEDEYYHSDLIGLAAVSPEGDRLGEIVGVHNYGAGDLLEVRVIGERKTDLIPFEKSYVPEVDLQRRCITVVRPTYQAESEEGAP
jgi:16S rRNA processing protein RimM